MFLEVARHSELLEDTVGLGHWGALEGEEVEGREAAPEGPRALRPLQVRDDDLHGEGLGRAGLAWRT